MLTAAAAVLLLVTAFGTLGANRAPLAHASVRGTTVSGGLSVSVNPGSVVVGLATVSATVTYTCTDTSAPTGDAVLRVEFEQNNAGASTEVDVPCGSGEIDQTQTVTAAQLGMSGSQEVTAAAFLMDGRASASSLAEALVEGTWVGIDSSVTYPGDGTVTLSGFYNCTRSASTGGGVFINAHEINASSTTKNVIGSAVVATAVCNGTNQPWSANVTSSNSGSYTDTATLMVSADGKIPTVGGGADFRSGSAVDYSVFFK
ncbi:DUF6299 family protein [Kitasatospora sp. NPDC004531]